MAERLIKQGKVRQRQYRTSKQMNSKEYCECFCEVEAETMKDWTLWPLLCKRSNKMIVTVPFGLKNPCMYERMNESMILR